MSRLAEHGAELAILDLEAPASDAWPSASVDVTDEAAVRDAARTLAGDGAPFDGLVAAAGIVPNWHSPEDIELDVLDRTMSVNVLGFVNAMKCLAPAMPDGATIVAIKALGCWSEFALRLPL